MILYCWSGKIQTGENHVRQGLSKVFVFFTYSSNVETFIFERGRRYPYLTWKHSSLSRGVFTERGRYLVWFGFSRDRMRSSWLLSESIRWQVAASSYNLSLCESKQQQLKNSDLWFLDFLVLQSHFSQSQRSLAASNLYRLWSLDVLFQASTHLQGPALVKPHYFSDFLTLSFSFSHFVFFLFSLCLFPFLTLSFSSHFVFFLSLCLFPLDVHFQNLMSTIDGAEQRVWKIISQKESAHQQS